MVCGRIHARLYPQTRQNDSCDDRAATVPAPPSLPCSQVAALCLHQHRCRDGRARRAGPIQCEMPTLSGSDRFETDEEEEEEEKKAAMGSLAKSAGSIHSHPKFNILMRSWNRRSNKERDGEGGRKGGRERKRVALFNNENWAEISQAARERERERGLP